MSNGSIVIVDYGLGNLFSVEGALQKLGASGVKISQDKKDIHGADRVILPGVGAFGDGMQNLHQRGQTKALVEAAAAGTPILGVCLGMQLLMTQSEEFGLHQGLDLVPGNVRQLRSNPDRRMKIPQIGWNSLHPSRNGPGRENPWSGTVLHQFDEGLFMYFLHSFVVEPEDDEAWLATTNYGDDSFCSVLKQGNITGVQFHPERSGEEGLRIYQEFLSQT